METQRHRGHRESTFENSCEEFGISLPTRHLRNVFDEFSVCECPGERVRATWKWLVVNESDKLSGWIGRYGGPLTYWLRGRCLNPEDVVQEAFCRLMQQKPLPERVGAWLFQVAANLAKEEVRRSRRREQREAHVAKNESRNAVGFAKVEQDEVRLLVESLPQPLREVVVARLWGELTWAEIAELLQTPQTTLYRRYEEALVALKDKLEPNQ